MRYVVSVSDLYRKAKELRDDKMDYVELSFMPPDEATGLPAAVHFQAWQRNADHDEDFEEIDVVDPAG